MNPASVNVAVEWTPIIVAVIGGVFAVIRVVSVYLIDKRVKDHALAVELENAVTNSLGTIQQAAAGAVTPALTPQVSHADIPADLKPGVQYVLDHASEPIARFQKTWTAATVDVIAEKITSRKGLAEIQTNLAISGSATPAVAPPLAPVPTAAAAIVLPAG